MDSLMLAGCSSFVVASVVGFLLVVWPFIAFPEVNRLKTLGFCCAVGFIPSTLLAMVVVRKAGLPGACGSVAGAMTTAIFLYLRISQAFLAYSAQQAPPPQYPQLFQSLLPLAWVVFMILLGIVLLPKGELPSPEE